MFALPCLLRDYCQNATISDLFSFLFLFYCAFRSLNTLLSQQDVLNRGNKIIVTFANPPTQKSTAITAHSLIKSFISITPLFSCRMPEQSNDYRVIVFGAGGVGKRLAILFVIFVTQLRPS